MTKIEITKTELVWPGKYNEDGTLKEVARASLPFQVIETVVWWFPGHSLGTAIACCLGNP